MHRAGEPVSRRERRPGAVDFGARARNLRLRAPPRRCAHGDWISSVGRSAADRRVLDAGPRTSRRGSSHQSRINLTPCPRQTASTSTCDPRLPARSRRARTGTSPATVGHLGASRPPRRATPPAPHRGRAQDPGDNLSAVRRLPPGLTYKGGRRAAFSTCPATLRPRPGRSLPVYGLLTSTALLQQHDRVEAHPRGQPRNWTARRPAMWRTVRRGRRRHTSVLTGLCLPAASAAAASGPWTRRCASRRSAGGGGNTGLVFGVAAHLLACAGADPGLRR